MDLNLILVYWTFGKLPKMPPASTPSVEIVFKVMVLVIWGVIWFSWVFPMCTGRIHVIKLLFDLISSRQFVSTAGRILKGRVELLLFNILFYFLLELKLYKLTFVHLYS